MFSVFIEIDGMISSNSDIVFFHIPKAAGNSLFNRMGSDCGRVPVNFRSIGQSEFNQHLRQPSPQLWTSHPCGGFTRWAELFQFRSSLIKITMLRRPLDRYVSHYFYNLKYFEMEDISLENTLTLPVHKHLMVNNLQTKIIAADGESFDYSLSATGEMLERAKRNLVEKFVGFGLLEHFEPSYLLLARTLGFKASAPAVKVNQNPVKDYMSRVPAKLQSRIEAYNMHDMELYRFACDRFRENLERLF